MRHTFLFLFVSLSCFVLSAQKTLMVTAETQNCEQDLALYKFDGTTFKPVVAATGKEGIYEFKIPAEGHSFYYYGADPSRLAPIILGGEEGVVLNINCQGNAPSVVINSTINDQYTVLKTNFNEINQRNQAAVQTYRQSMRQTELKPKAIAMMGAVDQERLQLLDSLKTANPFLARVAALNTYLSYFNHGQDAYDNEIAYFAREFFQFVDWQDEAYYELPWVYEGFKNYTSTLAQVFTDEAAFTAAVDPTFAEIPQGSMAEKLALGGVVAILKQKNHPAFKTYAQQFIDHFGETDPQAAADLEQQVASVASFMIGGQAPDFQQATPDGKMLSLSDLRGKVVLVDFWASWCGPCRRENPNVKRVYDEYKEKGFEILGVSLDRTEDRWLQAIEKDGLQWLQVSDLKGWKNEVALMYSVSSIPHTILLDAEGKIIARGLRGKQLEDKLAEIFAEK
jgi:thiol-disulfide isomerase/thioredoxin